MMRLFTMLILLLTLILPGAVAAKTDQRPGTMPVAVFLAKAEALRAKGAMALFSSDYGQLKAEVAGAAQAFRRQIKAQATNGTPSACLPERAALSSDDVLAHMRSYPANARARIPVADAVADLLRKRYPCPSR
jgi:hypothetical protein